MLAYIYKKRYFVQNIIFNNPRRTTMKRLFILCAILFIGVCTYSKAENLDSLNQFTGWEYSGNIRTQKLKTAPFSFSQLISKGKEIITGDSLGYVRIWNIETGKLRYSNLFDKKNLVACCKDSLIVLNTGNELLIDDSLFIINISSQNSIIRTVPLSQISYDSRFKSNAKHYINSEPDGYEIYVTIAVDLAPLNYFSRLFTVKYSTILAYLTYYPDDHGFIRRSKNNSVSSYCSRVSEGYDAQHSLYIFLSKSQSSYPKPKKITTGFDYLSSFTRNNDYFIVGKSDTLYLCNTKQLDTVITKSINYNINQFVIDTNDNIVTLNDPGNKIIIGGWRNSISHTELDLPYSVGNTKIIFDNDSSSVILAGNSGILMIAPLVNSSNITAAVEASRTEIFKGEQVDFHPNIKGLSNKFKWILSNGYECNDYDFKYIFKETGVYDLTFIAANGEKSDTIFYKNFITVSPKPKTATAKFSENQRFGYLPFTVKFSNTTEKPYTSIFWDFGDGTISNEDNPTHTFNKLGTYEVTLKVINNLDTLILTKEFNAISQELQHEQYVYGLVNGVFNYENYYHSIFPTNNGTYFINLRKQFFVNLTNKTMYQDEITSYHCSKELDTLTPLPINEVVIGTYFDNGYITDRGIIYDFSNRFLFDLPEIMPGKIIADRSRDSLFIYNDQMITYYNQYFEPLWESNYSKLANEPAKLLGIECLKNGDLSIYLYHETSAKTVRYLINPENGGLISRKDMKNMRNAKVNYLNDSLYYSLNDKELTTYNFDGEILNTVKMEFEVDSVYALDTNMLVVIGSDEWQYSLAWIGSEVLFFDSKLNLKFKHQEANRSGRFGGCNHIYPVMLNDKSIVFNNNLWTTRDSIPESEKQFYAWSFQQTRYFFPAIYNESGSVSVREPIQSEQASESYPNPAHNVITISTKDDIDIDKIEITDIKGNIITAKIRQHIGNRIIIDISMLTVGTYYYQINSNHRQLKGMFVKK